MTKIELMRLGIILENGVVFHSTKRRGNYPLKRHIQNVKDNPYYIFKHNGKTIAIREEVILKAYEEN